jgi:succinate dehydrogenase/fumarate reductase flavoprotein subunit
VVGATIVREGKNVEIRARRAVMLASGGFGANPVLRAKYIPFPESHVSLQPDSNVGDGLRLGQEAGGALGSVNAENGVWAPVSLRKRRDGGTDKYPHFGPDRAKPGSIIVATDAKRFANESAPYQTFVHAMHERGITTAFFIGNRRFVRNYGMGFAFPAPYPYGPSVRNGYLIEAPTVETLADKLGISAPTLRESIVEFNSAAKLGNDPQFGRGSNAYDRFLGDPANTPNPSLGTLTEGPYCAVRIHPGDVSTVFGLDTSPDGQVLAHNRAAIPGLYALGLDQNTVMRGIYPGGGSGIGPGMTFAFRAARHAARQASRS